MTGRSQVNVNWSMLSIPDVVILCGGAGLRLRSITGDVPKAMAAIGGRPFLELLLKQLRRNGLERAILAVGYQSQVIRSHFGEQTFGLSLAYAVEEVPLGTGGALRNAAALATSESVLVMNGDSYTDVDLCKLAEDHRQSEADLTVVVAVADGRVDCGTILVDRYGKLSVFKEKQGDLQAAYLNAGIYVVSRHLLCEIPFESKVSLERELIPAWLRQGKCIRAFISRNSCIDIGTPERYVTAQGALASAEAHLIVPQTEVQA
jgi:NDP-sugar pyrophosphorylase family protein